jgi:Na+/proline symporter
MVTKLLESNGMEASPKYLMARDERQARLTPVIPIVGTLLAPLLWLVPPTVAAIRHPDLAAQFPALKFPQEASFLVTAADVLPQGMLGLLVCGIFAATVTNLYADLNQGVGVFVRNFYLPVVRPGASERRLLAVCKIATGAFGGLVILLGLLVNRLCESNLFDLLNQLAVSLAIPLAAPLVYGLFFKRTPAWSSWSTVVVGLSCSLAVKLFFRPAMLDGVFGLTGPFLPEEQTQLMLIATVASVTLACTAWFFFTSVFYSRTSPAYRASADAFFARLHTPLADDANGARAPDGHATLAASIGGLCLVYGGFILLLTAIPNPGSGRLCFLACGGVIGGVGLALRSLNRRP